MSINGITTESYLEPLGVELMGDTVDLDGALFEAWEDVESCYSYNLMGSMYMVYFPT